jgi:SAM-dependent methyltransferase
MKYDEIGVGYDTTRRPDPRIAERLFALLDPKPGGRYIDIACGTGNYTQCLHARGLDVIGIDQSVTMLEAASTKFPGITWQQADATALPFPDGTFDGAVCTLAIHHFPDLDAAFREIGRVLSDGRVVIFTATPEQMRAYWLDAYFPQAMARAIAQMPSEDRLRAALAGAQFDIAGVEPWFVPTDPIDLFLYSGKHNPALYLDARIRSGMSTFAALAHAPEVEQGLSRLLSDSESGRICKVMAEYSSELGDYVFYTARKLRTAR